MKKMAFAAIAVATMSAVGAANAAIVINEVYPGGGASTGSPAYKTDFVELYNNGTTAVDLTGYVLTYGSSASAAGTFASFIGTLPSGASIPSKGYYVVVTGTPGSAGADNPTPDIAFTTYVAGVSGASLSNSAGAVRLQDSATTTLDVVGWGGTVSNFETAKVSNVGLTTAMSMQRSTNGVDTNNNSTDFTIAVPTPGAAVPEPTSMAVLGLAGLMGLRRSRKA